MLYIVYLPVCVCVCVGLIEGPPNRPNEDLYGLLEIVIHFLEVCDSATQAAVTAASAANNGSNGTTQNGHMTVTSSSSSSSSAVYR